MKNQKNFVGTHYPDGKGGYRFAGQPRDRKGKYSRKIGSRISTIILLSLFLIGVIAVAVNVFSREKIVEIDEPTKQVVVEVETPVLDRIAKCESGSSHYCTTDLITKGYCEESEKGQVLVRANTNKTVDVGFYQINLYYWGAKATELHLNLFDEKDNKEMADWIFRNKGTEDWYASKKCWYK